MIMIDMLLGTLMEIFLKHAKRIKQLVKIAKVNLKC